MNDLDALEWAAKAATPGPWFTENDGVYNATRGYMVTLTGDSDQDRLDAGFIAFASPSTVLELIAEIRRLRSAVRRIVHDVDEFDHATTQGGDRFALGGLEAAAVRSALTAEVPSE